MASAEQYAKWIVDNSDKKGTPEFDTVAQAYKIARQDSAPAVEAPKEKPSALRSVLEDTKTGLMLGGLPGAAMYPAMKRGNEAIAKLSYDAGGKVTDVATGLGASPEVAAGAGLAANVGLQAIPSVMGGGAATRMGAPLQSAARSLMQSALKPTIADLRSGQAGRAVNTLLEEGLSPTARGVETMQARVGSLNDEIAALIKNSPSTISKQAVTHPLQAQTIPKFTNQVNPAGDIAAIQKSMDDFLAHPSYIGKQNIPVQAAQSMKQGTYGILAKKYGQVGTAETEAQKALARGLKDEIALAVPEVSKLNAQESRLLDALSVAERRVLMDANKNPMGLSLLAHNPATWAAFLADRSAAFKGLAARMLNRGSERIPQAVVGTGIGGMLSTQQRIQQEDP